MVCFAQFQKLFLLLLVVEVLHACNVGILVDLLWTLPNSSQRLPICIFTDDTITSAGALFYRMFATLCHWSDQKLASAWNMYSEILCATQTVLTLIDHATIC